jgi:uncharacterized protein (DUF305 family)
MKRLVELVGILAALAGSVAIAGNRDRGFSDAMNAAMDRMMAKMYVHASGDVDRQFVELMIPHHQGAIDMAVAELRYGRNVQLKRIAQEIIVDQQEEITAMDLAVGAALPRGAPAPTQQSVGGAGRAP